MKNKYKMKRFTGVILLLLSLMLFSSKDSKAVVYQLGTATTTTTASGITPFSTFWHDNRIQYLYLASELTAAGASAGTITSAAFNITSLGSPTPLNVNISISATAATSISSLATAGFTTCYSAASLTPTIGWNTYTFGTSFLWDGTSNLLIEVCRDNTSYSSSYGVEYTAQSVNRVYGLYTDGASGCTMTTANVANSVNRPNIRLDITPSAICSGAPSAGTTTGPAGVCAGVGFAVGLSGATSASGITYQWQSSPDGITYTNIAGATSATATVSQTSATYYRCIVTCTSSGLSATSTPLLVNTNPLTAACYCSSAATTTFDEEITNVTVGTLNNSSNCTVAAPGPGSILARYANYTSGAGIPAAPSFPRTSTMSFSVTVGSCGTTNFTSGLAIFIDFNQDGDFLDAGEKVYSNGTASNINCVPATIVSGSFVIPVGATLGNTMMRVIDAEGTPGNSITPCLATFGYGETEDYLVNIAPVPLCPSPSGLSATGITTTSANLNWTCTTCTGTFSLEYGPSGFTPGTGTIVSPATSPVPVSGLTPGTSYQFYVTQDCSGAGNGFSIPTGPQSFTTTALGDDVCTAVPLSFGANGPYSNVGMTVQAGEPAPPASGCTVQTGWCENALSNTRWFSFVAPASGRVSIASPGFDTQLALWSAANCGAVTTGGATLIAANDDGGPGFSSVISPVNCLTQGTTYYVQLDGYFGATGSATINLTDLGAVNPAFSGLTSPVCTNASAMTLTPVTTGGVFAGTGISGSTFSPSVAGAGTYSVTYTLNGCYTSTQSVTVLPAPTASSVISAPIMCNGGTATIDVTATGGSGTYSGTGSFTGVPAGPYTYTVTDANTCTSTTTGTVTQPTPLVVNVTTTPILCNGGSSNVSVSGSGGTPTYTGEGSSTEFAGTFTYTVMDFNGCTASSTVTINEPAPISLSFTETGVMCNGGTSDVTVTSTGGTSPWDYNWVGSSGSIHTATDITAPDMFTVAAGTYTVTVTDANSCTATITLNITEPTVLTSTYTQSGISCFGGLDTINLIGSGGTLPYTGTGPYTQLNGATNTYTLTDAKGCTTTQTVSTTSEPTELFISSGATTVLCNGGTATVTVGAIGGTPAYTGTGTFPQAAGTTVTYTVTDNNGCSVSSTIVTNNPPPVSVTATSASVLCFGDSASITVSASGGTGALSGTGTFMQAAGTVTYTVTDANGCTGTASATVTQPSTAPMVMYSSTPVLCNGDSSAVTITGMDGTPGYTGEGTFNQVGGSTMVYTINDANGCAATASVTISQPAAIVSSQSFSVCPGGSVVVGTNTYNTAGTYTDIFPAANSCDSTVTTTLIINTAPVVTATADNDSVCTGTMVTLTGSGAVSYAWDNSVVDGVAFTPSGTLTYNVVGTDGNGCMDTASILVVVNTLPTVTATSDNDSICPGASVTLTGGGASSYVWDNSVVDGVAFSPVATTTYNVVGTDVNGCTNTANTTVVVNPLPSVNMSAFTAPVCLQASPVTLTGGTPAGGTYSGTGVTAGVFDPSASGIGTFAISYTVTDANGCTNTASSNVTVQDCTGINEVASSDNVSVYPNPTIGVFTITVLNANFSELEISITDVQGKLVYISADKNVSGTFKKRISFEELSKGVYYVKVNTGADVIVKKLIIQ